MISICILLLAVEFALSFKFDLNVYSDKFDLTKVNNQDLYHTKSTEDSNKWLVFPLQLDYHHSIFKSRSSSLLKNYLKNNEFKIDSAFVIHHYDSSFWKVYSKYLNLHKDVEMKLFKEFSKKTSLKKIKLYQQYIYGFQVFGGDYKVSIGAHDGITHIHGHSFPTIDETYDYIQSLEDLSRNAFKEEDLFKIFLKYSNLKSDENIDNILISAKSIEEYTSNNEKNIVDHFEIVDGSFEMIWFENTSSKLVLVYHFKVTDKLNHVTQDIFIDFHSLQVVNIIKNPSYNTNSEITKVIDDLVNKIQITPNNIGTSPFTASSFTSEVIVAEVIPNIVFNSSNSNISAYPTASNEINTLVDSTLYIKYLIYSLSNGEFITWEKYQRSLLIAYNEPGVSNAQFDPTK